MQIAALVTLVIATTASCNAFVVQHQRPRQSAVSYRKAHNENEPEKMDALSSSRRSLLGTVLSASAAVLGMSSAVVVSSSQPAHATYSAYTRREEDWQSRVKNNEIQFSTAKELRAQLREIAPMNSEGSKIFCPNGPSASVSPLMENKCGDRIAMPSVYGRSDDVLGNSIPGFNGSLYVNNAYDSKNLRPADVGGFPSYGK